MARPGIMLYFDMLEPLRALPDADKGRLLVAMLEYGKDGTDPQFDGMLALAWGFVKPKLDRDSEEYGRTILKRQYATFCRGLKRKGLPEIDFNAWMIMSDAERDQMLSHDIKCYPTTTTTVTPTTTITPTTTTAAAVTTTDLDDTAAAAADKKLKLLCGELGQGVVVLSDFQIEALLDKLGLDMFDHYVSKLANFIIKNDAKVGSHYATILKWWVEDSQT